MFDWINDVISNEATAPDVIGTVWDVNNVPVPVKLAPLSPGALLQVSPVSVQVLSVIE